jgi:mono/diheme cytochrome c family protein
MKTICRIIALFAFSCTNPVFAGTGLVAAAADLGYPRKDAPEAAVFRGAIVFEHYCALCHGKSADGSGPAAKLYSPKPANLVLSDMKAQFKEQIVRGGGRAIARSDAMPAWEKQLTEEQITDVVTFLGVITSSTLPRH